VRFPTSQIAARAIALTLDMIDGIEPAAAVHTIGAPELVVRESTGVAPG
jgi:DNA-binding LacI/PurR family transcriptional regulator